MYRRLLSEGSISFVSNSFILYCYYDFQRSRKNNNERKICLLIKQNKILDNSCDVRDNDLTLCKKIYNNNNKLVADETIRKILENKNYDNIYYKCTKIITDNNDEIIKLRNDNLTIEKRYENEFLKKIAFAYTGILSFYLPFGVEIFSKRALLSCILSIFEFGFVSIPIAFLVAYQFSYAINKFVTDKMNESVYKKNRDLIEKEYSELELLMEVNGFRV